jgi:hypothetical protein
MAKKVKPNGRTAQAKPTLIYNAEEKQPQSEELIDFDTAVVEGKQIVAKMETNEQDMGLYEMQLGELADRLKPRYGDKTLACFAKEIGVVACTLKRRRTVFRAWKGIGAPAPRSFAIAQELAPLLNRAEIIKNNPNISRRQARVKVNEWKRVEKEKSQPIEYRRLQTKKWVTDLYKLAQKAVQQAEITDQTYEEAILRDMIEPAYGKAARPC